MAKHPWLFKRGDRYYLRARVPKELVASYKKSEIKRSLGTADRREAEKLVRIESAKIEREFEDRKRSLAVKDQPLETVPAYVLEDIVRQWLVQHLARMEGSDDTFMASEDELVEWRTNIEQDISEYRSAIARRDTSLVYSEAKMLLAGKNIAPETDQKAFRKFCLLLLRARLEAAQRGLQDLQSEARTRQPVVGLFLNTSAPVASPAPPQTSNPVSSSSILLGDLIDLHAKHLQRKAVSPKTTLGYKIIIKTLEELFTRNKPVNEITRDDCREVLALLERLPTNASKRYPGKSVREWAAMGDAKAISPKTLATNMGNLSALFSFAVDEHLINRNPAYKLYSIPKGAKGKRKAFSVEQLNKIFRHPPFDRPFAAGNLRRKRASSIPMDAHKFWAPLLALWTGLRANEILQLGTVDIQKISDVDVIRVAIDTTRDDMRLKSADATRIVPIHPELKRLGFLTFARSQAEGGETLLFPDTKVDAHGYRSDDFSKWFVRHLKAAGAVAPQTSFHSFRHNFRDALRNAGVPQERSRRLGGWAGDGGADEGYGSGFSATELFKEIRKISYPNLSLSHLMDAQGD